MIALEDKLYDLAMAYWDLQKHNYDIESNYPELLDFDFEAPDLLKRLDEVITLNRQIWENEKPKAEPEVDNIFQEDIAPVPNNSVINVVARAIMAGGPEYGSKVGGWKKRKDRLIYEAEFEKAGTITIAIEDSEDPIAVIESLNVFTLDVLVWTVGHLSFARNKNPSDNPLTLKSIVTTKQLLRYKKIKSHGERRWKLIEKVNREIEKLAKFGITVKDATGRKGQQSYKGRLFTVKPVKRDFNRHTKYYVQSSWEIKPGSWAVYLMSNEQDRFIGKLNRATLEFEHREQRGYQTIAKKLVYALFIIPGGTHYLRYGAKKNIAQYLTLIGEYHEKNDPYRNRGHRSLCRMGEAIDFLVNQQIITTSMEESLSNYITNHSKPWSMRKILEKVIEIKPGPALTCPT